MLVDLENIHANLCTGDIRNPEHADLYDDFEDKPDPRGKCMCDNCFYGRDPLAIIILRLLKEN